MIDNIHHLLESESLSSTPSFPSNLSTSFLESYSDDSGNAGNHSNGKISESEENNQISNAKSKWQSNWDSSKNHHHHHHHHHKPKQLNNLHYHKDGFLSDDNVQNDEVQYLLARQKHLFMSPEERKEMYSKVRDDNSKRRKLHKYLHDIRKEQKEQVKKEQIEQQKQSVAKESENRVSNSKTDNHEQELYQQKLKTKSNTNSSSKTQQQNFKFSAYEKIGDYQPMFPIQEYAQEIKDDMKQMGITDFKEYLRRTMKSKGNYFKAPQSSRVSMNQKLNQHSGRTYQTSNPKRRDLFQDLNQEVNTNATSKYKSVSDDSFDPRLLILPLQKAYDHAQWVKTHPSTIERNKLHASHFPHNFFYTAKKVMDQNELRTRIQRQRKVRQQLLDELKQMQKKKKQEIIKYLSKQEMERQKKVFEIEAYKNVRKRKGLKEKEPDQDDDVKENSIQSVKLESKSTNSKSDSEIHAQTGAVESSFPQTAETDTAAPSVPSGRTPAEIEAANNSVFNDVKSTFTKDELLSALKAIIKPMFIVNETEEDKRENLSADNLWEKVRVALENQWDNYKKDENDIEGNPILGGTWNMDNLDDFLSSSLKTGTDNPLNGDITTLIDQAKGNTNLWPRVKSFTSLFKDPGPVAPADADDATKVRFPTSAFGQKINILDEVRSLLKLDQSLWDQAQEKPEATDQLNNDNFEPQLDEAVVERQIEQFVQWVNEVYQQRTELSSAQGKLMTPDAKSLFLAQKAIKEFTSEIPAPESIFKDAFNPKSNLKMLSELGIEGAKWALDKTKKAAKGGKKFYRKRLMPFKD